ncbi:MAG: hypothetical protein ACKOUR_06590 [Planctomycetota bacterium]
MLLREIGRRRKMLGIHPPLDAEIQQSSLQLFNIHLRIPNSSAPGMVEIRAAQFKEIKRFRDVVGFVSLLL